MPLINPPAAILLTWRSLPRAFRAATFARKPDIHAIVNANASARHGSTEPGNTIRLVQSMMRRGATVPDVLHYPGTCWVGGGITAKERSYFLKRTLRRYYKAQRRAVGAP